MPNGPQPGSPGLLAQLRDVIKEHLPEELSGALRTRIEDLEEKEEKLSRVNDSVLAITRERDAIREDNTRLKDNARVWERREEELQKREDEVAEAELKMANTILEAKVESQEREITRMESLVDRFLRNPVLKYSGTVPVALEATGGFTDQYGNVTLPPAPARVEAGEVETKTETE